LENYSTEGSIGDIYHSKEYFFRNYEAMQRDFKVFVYRGGNPTTCYDPKDKLKSIYASEHYFFMNLIDSQFLTNDPHKAHLFFIPISCHRIGGKVCAPIHFSIVYCSFVLSMLQYKIRDFDMFSGL